ncbi:MAG: hypothetical protein Q7T35_02690, partial [Nitrosomonas sp.]|nr:hypothetical protein [Nitrosomonas sp.]
MLIQTWCYIVEHAAIVAFVLIRLSPNDCSRGCFWPESGVWSHFRKPNVGHTDIGLRKSGSLWDTRHSLGANRIST